MSRRDGHALEGPGVEPRRHAKYETVDPLRKPGGEVGNIPGHLGGEVGRLEPKVPHQGREALDGLHV